MKDLKGENIGEVISGAFSPCLKKNIAMRYVKSRSHKAGTKVKLLVRGKACDGAIIKIPFVPANITIHPNPSLVLHLLVF